MARYSQVIYANLIAHVFGRQHASPSELSCWDHGKAETDIKREENCNKANISKERAVDCVSKAEIQLRMGSTWGSLKTKVK